MFRLSVSQFPFFEFPIIKACSKVSARGFFESMKKNLKIDDFKKEYLSDLEGISEKIYPKVTIGT